ncbi:biopolymer transporter ExbD [Parasulfuritortus cantonensis]|uniref:Biopolymer transporter ExbD n=1 Tax=Parasulfuritortus cantonensis TaxID=2528202 RepID=A0A4R1B0Z5_9PROT|nr:biopolymer transporter ExbD [Parasulfuritortus cantonensis]TCJ11654.1 biopolymer transporter ExbD [Parasulfuritortus cantonensis]
MAFAENDGADFAVGTRPMADINMIPLIDVMLVLLVVFMVTAPLLTHAVRVDLPEAASHPEVQHPDDLNLAIRADGALYWNDLPIAAAELPARMAAAAAASPVPELHIRADRQVPYGRVAEVMAAAARAGLDRIGFVSEPHSDSP